MTALVKSLGEFLTLLVQAFNLSSIFPSLVFVLLLRLFVMPMLPNESLESIEYMLSPLGEGGSLAIVVILLAYLLDAANMQIIRFFEGYHLLKQFPFDRWRERHQKHVGNMIDQVDTIEVWLDRLIELVKDELDDKKREQQLSLAMKLADHRTKLLNCFQNKYPKDVDYVLPTPFGNVIAAAEQYPYEAFGMDAVTLWPFLRPILTEKEYAQYLVREKAIMDFLVNLTLILAIFGMIYGLVLWIDQGISRALILSMIVVVASCLIMFWLAVQGAASWGTTVRAAFVVFREDLRKKLRLRRVADYEDERALWQNASQFFKVESHEDQQLDLGAVIFNVSSYSSD